MLQLITKQRSNKASGHTCAIKDQTWDAQCIHCIHNGGSKHA